MLGTRAEQGQVPVKICYCSKPSGLSWPDSSYSLCGRNFKREEGITFGWHYPRAACPESWSFDLRRMPDLFPGFIRLKIEMSIKFDRPTPFLVMGAAISDSGH